MTQTAEQIHAALETWIETSPVLPTYWSDGQPSPSGYTNTITDLTDLVWYLEGEAPVDSDGRRWLEIPGVEGVILLKETKGGEGEGDYAHAVLEIVYAMSDSRYFMLDGYHRSYDGTYFDSGFHEVKPVQKLVDDWSSV